MYKMTDVTERFLEFPASIIKLFENRSKNFAFQHISLQLIRSSTSSGANFHESRSAESRRDFIHKMKLSLKELRESLFWLQLINRTNLLNNDQQTIEMLIQENTELIKILSTSVSTARKKRTTSENSLDS